MALNLKLLDPATRSISDLIRQLNGWRDVINSLGFPPLSRGVLLEVTLPSGTSEVGHGLRAVPRGWVVLRNIRSGATPAAVAEVAASEQTITLALTQPATLTLWIYG